MRRQSRRVLAYPSPSSPLLALAAAYLAWRECEPRGRSDFEAPVYPEVSCDD